jgi:CysZ protein
MFLDEVAQAVEDRHYPELPHVPGVPFGEALRDTINFLGVLIGGNLLAILLYVFFAPAALFIFWGLNGYLLGREYFMLAAMRRIGRAKAKELRSQYAGTIWLAGTLMAIPLTVPLVNLLIPILGAATFTHIYHMLAKRG